MSNKSLPTVTSNIPRDLRTFTDRVRDVIAGTGGSRLVSAQDLADAGVANIDSRGNLTPAVQDLPVYGPPPAPTNVTASAAISNVVVEWDAPLYANHAYAEIWGADTDNIGAAVLLAQTPGAIYSDPLGPSKTRYYWVRFVNVQFTTGAFNATAGVPATTGSDLAYTMDLLSDTYGGSSQAPFFQLDAPQVIGGVTIPAGTYMKAAYIYNGTITNAKIGTAAVDNSKISDLSATKLTAGSLSVGTYIQSSGFIAGSTGWKISSDGTAEFAAASIRGQVVASQIDSRGLTIKDAAGNLLFGSGTPISPANLDVDVGGINLLANSDFTAFTATANQPAGYAIYNSSGVGGTYVAATGYSTSTGMGVKAGATPGSRIGITTNNTLTYGGITGGIDGGWKANTKYVIAFYVKKVNGTGFTGMSLFWNTGSSPAATVVVENPAPTTSYQRYIFRITTGATVEANANLYIATTGTVATNDEIHIDRVSVQEGDYYGGWYPGNKDMVGVNNKMTATNLNTFIADTTIGLAKIDTATITNLSAITADMGSITAGQIKFTDPGNATNYIIIDGATQNIRVYNNNVLRVKIGNLA